MTIEKANELALKACEWATAKKAKQPFAKGNNIYGTDGRLAVRAHWKCDGIPIEDSGDEEGRSLVASMEKIFSHMGEHRRVRMSVLDYSIISLRYNDRYNKWVDQCRREDEMRYIEFDCPTCDRRHWWDTVMEEALHEKPLPRSRCKAECSHPVKVSTPEGYCAFFNFAYVEKMRDLIPEGEWELRKGNDSDPLNDPYYLFRKSDDACVDAVLMPLHMINEKEADVTELTIMPNLNSQKGI